MSVDYAHDPMGRVTFHFDGDHPRQDFTDSRVAGVILPTYLVADVTTGLLGTLHLEVSCSSKGIRVTEYGITKTPKGRPINRAMVERAARELDGMVRHALYQWRRTFQHEDDIHGKPLDADRLWAALLVGMMPPQRGGESRREYVLRLWEETYKPAGRTQAELAADVGLAPITVREYVSETRRGIKP